MLSPASQAMRNFAATSLCDSAVALKRKMNSTAESQTQRSPLPSWRCRRAKLTTLNFHLLTLERALQPELDFTSSAGGCNPAKVCVQWFAKVGIGRAIRKSLDSIQAQVGINPIEVCPVESIEHQPLVQQATGDLTLALFFIATFDLKQQSLDTAGSALTGRHQPAARENSHLFWFESCALAPSFCLVSAGYKRFMKGGHNDHYQVSSCSSISRISP